VIEIFLVDENRVTETFTMGDHFPFHRRPIDHHNFVTPVYWPAEKTLDVYLHVRSSGAMQLPLTIWHPADFSASDQKRQLASGLYFGAMFIMVLYNLFMYFGIGDRSFIFYVGFVACISLFVSSLTGYSFQYLWPDAISWNEKSIGFFLSLAVNFAVMFTHRFLGASDEARPWLVRNGLRMMYLLSVAMLLSSLLMPYTRMLVIVIGGSVLACIAALMLGIYGWVKGEIAARHYVLAWSSVMIGGLVLAGNKASVLPQNAVTENAVQIGSLMLVALLSFAIAHRINEERRRRYDAQYEALTHERNARAAKEDALLAQQRANAELEKKVEERTEALRKANTILEELSETDVLTGLKNRRYLDEAGKREYVRCFRYRRPVSLVFVDLDHFKSLNDTHGHLIGDDCLRMVAGILTSAVIRDSDVIARYGGEEFCLLLPETEMEGAAAVAERIRRLIETEEFVVAGKRIPLTASFGVACHIPEAPDQLGLLIRQADEALYHAKGSGRNRVCRFSSGRA
jgi:diguanylate cyclase